MPITDLLAQMGGLQSMARELGVSEAEAASGAAALAPAVLGGFKSQAKAQPAGLEGLDGQRAPGGLHRLLRDVEHLRTTPVDGPAAAPPRHAPRAAGGDAPRPTRPGRG